MSQPILQKDRPKCRHLFILLTVKTGRIVSYIHIIIYREPHQDIYSRPNLPFNENWQTIFK